MVTLAKDSNAYGMNPSGSNDLHAENALRFVSKHEPDRERLLHEKHLVLLSQEFVAEGGALLVLQHSQKSEGLVIVGSRNENMGGEAVNDVQRNKEEALEEERQVVADEGGGRV